MNKAELIERLAKPYPQLVAKDLEVTVKMILEAMCNRLMGGQRAEIRGFGAFHLNYRPSPIGRNQKSGEAVKVAAKYVPHFRPGKELRERARSKSARRSSI